MVKVSRSMKEKGYLISNARKELTDMLGREPELKELAEKTGLSEEEIVLAVEANGEVESIYQSVYQSDGSEIYLLDRLKDKKNAQEELENKLLIEELLQQLSGREQQLIKMRYFENATQSQIAAKGMPFAESPYGFLIIVLIAVVCSLIVALIFAKTKMFK